MSLKLRNLFVLPETININHYGFDPHDVPSLLKVLLSQLPPVAPQLQAHCLTELAAAHQWPAKTAKPLLRLVGKLVALLKSHQEVCVCVCVNTHQMFSHSCRKNWLQRKTLRERSDINCSLWFLGNRLAQHLARPWSGLCLSVCLSVHLCVC